MNKNVHKKSILVANHGWFKIFFFDQSLPPENIFLVLCLKIQSKHFKLEKIKQKNLQSFFILNRLLVFRVLNLFNFRSMEVISLKVFHVI